MAWERMCSESDALVYQNSKNISMRQRLNSRSTYTNCKQNESVGDQQVIKLDWSRKIRSQLLHNRFTVTLLKCDRENPPRRRDEDVRVEGEIVCQVNVAFDQLPQYTQDGEVWKSLDFQVEMKPCGTMLEFAAYFNGQRQRVLQVSPPFAPSEEVATA
jgi:hypothetical protein